MRQSAWKAKQQHELAQKQKMRWEFLALLFICLAMGGGFLAFNLTNGKTAAEKPAASGFSQMLLQSDSASTVSRSIPADYKTKGKVDDRYTLTQDPKSGQFVISDTLGGVGTNNTSIDGDRAKLASDMVELEQYADNNRNKLSPAAYNWLKKVARTGMKLAFGTPGIPAYAQPGIKQDLLAEFHNISANPEKSFMLTARYLALEKALERPESAYLAERDVNKTNYLSSYDPLSSPLRTANLSLQGYQLAPSLSPTAERLTSPTSPFAYTVYNTPVLTASTSSPTTTTTSPTLTSTTTHSPTLSSTISTAPISTHPTLSTSTAPISPTLSATPSATISPTLSTSTLSTATISPTLSTTTSATPTEPAPTVAQYYDSILGTNLSPSSPTLAPTTMTSPTTPTGY